MSAQTVIVQLSDPHIGADWGNDTDPTAALAAAVGTVLALDLHPAAVLVSGDLADSASAAEYAEARRLLDRIDAPICVLPGNHDDRGELRRHFELPGRGDEPVQHARAFGGLRLVALDTTRPGEGGGALDADRLDWLDADLATHPTVPTLLAMHHPPLATGIAPWDRIGLPGADRRALAEVIRRHPQVRRLTCGHLHRTIVSELAGCPLLVVPSTYVQARLDLRAERLELSDDPAGFAVHNLTGGQLLSHVVPVV